MMNAEQRKKLRGEIERDIAERCNMRWDESKGPDDAIRVLCEEVTVALDRYADAVCEGMRKCLERVDKWLEDGPVEESGEISSYIDGLELVTDLELRREVREAIDAAMSGDE